MPGTDPCAKIHGPGKEYCLKGQQDGGGPPATGHDDGSIVGGASEYVKDLAEKLLDALKSLVAPASRDTWAPKKPDSWVYEQFLWLGQHMAIAIFLCVVVVCALTAWQGMPRLRQMGLSLGWTLVAVAGMASVPGAVMLLNKAVNQTLTAAFNGNESSLAQVIRDDLASSNDLGPLGSLLIISALVVALAFAVLVYMTRQPAMLVFVCLAPLVLASLARGGDTSAVWRWANRLLGLIFAPFALLVLTPFASLAKGNLVLDGALLVAADVIMLRMIFHGVPYIGPRVSRAARAMVEDRTESVAVRGLMRAGVPDFYEEENTPRERRTVPTPGRAVTRDRDVLFAAYGVSRPSRPGRPTIESAVAKAQKPRDAERYARITQARQQARQQARAATPQNPAAPRVAAPRTAAPRPSANRPTPPQRPASPPTP
ncbi:MULTISPECIES: hypothetical protein [unclassified Streptomyces]|uniref:hypothetical protein n=1 Tax=unclassified Streptomyces TaxID=2593676 RepID=UPI0036F8A151